MSIKRTNQEKKSDEMKQHVTEIARKLFSEYGYKKVSVRDIAEHAKVTTGTLYYYFKNKEDILDAAYRNDSEEFEEKLKEKIEDVDEDNLILYFFSNIMVERILEDGLEFTRHRIFELKRQWDNQSDFYRIICHMLHKCEERGELDPTLTVEQIADYLLLVFRATMTEWARSNGQYQLKENMEWNISLAIRSISR